ncbi:NAD(P)/FAD-dependent oxidoreductase [Amycolatopsis sp. NPDC059027]|uniref:NAD(P)/FAD-dependent oxidoreductase n=1 Tax=Amycolatopsis sp. NPDC059027 TaxID=3346709 RepID=UPI003673065B
MTHRLVILGAGYAGLRAAKRAAKLLRDRDVRVTLVDREGRFFERVRTHQLATGQELRERRLPDVLAGTGIDLVTATVTGIDLDGRTVLLDAEPHAVLYDTLVYALGSGADVDAVSGVREHALTVAGPAGAEQLRARLDALPAKSAVVVVGGGLTGIEAATEIAEIRPDLRVELMCDAQMGGWLSGRAQRHLHRAFERREIGLREGVRVAKVGPKDMLLEDGGSVPADAVVWAAGFRVPALAAEAGLAVDGRGRMRVDERLRSVSHPEVYGVGDAAAGLAAGGRETRMSCQTGLPMGQYAAGAIARELTGRHPKPARIRYEWQNISLGRRDGVTQFTRADDSPVNVVLTGRVSAWFKEMITRLAAWMTVR